MLDSHGKILVVDDNTDIINYLSRILEREHYDVITTTKGKEAVRLAIKQHPDLIILDIIMPDMHGDKVAEVLTKNPLTVKIPILFLTISITKYQEQAFDRRRGDCYILAKPAGSKEILEIINKVLHTP